MIYKVDKKDGKAYLQLYQQLRDDIVAGVFPYGSRLPSKRTIAHDTGLSLITVEHSFDILIDEGYIEAKERSGYFVSYREKELLNVSERMEEYPTVKKRPSSQEDFPFSVYAKTVRKVLSQYQEQVLDKSENQGSIHLRQAISNYLKRSRGIVADVDQIFIGAGSEYLYNVIAQVFGKNKIYGLEQPSYGMIENVYKAMGVRIDHLKMGKFGILSEELERTPASILHVTPYRSMPTGITANASKRREYLAWAKERDAIIIEDDYDSEFSSLMKSEDTLYALDDNECVVYLNTFTQSISSGVRVAYMVLPKKYLQQCEDTIGFYSCTVPLLSQLTLSELINDGSFERYINRMRRLRRNNST